MRQVFDTSWYDSGAGKSFQGHRFMQTWESEERKTVVELFDSGFSLEYICKDMERPPAGVLSKLAYYGKIQRSVSDGLYYVCVSEGKIEKEPKMGNECKVACDMKAKLFETKVFILGREASTWSDGDILSLIRDRQNELVDLGTLNVTSKRVDAMKKAKQAEIDKLVEFLDGRQNTGEEG